MSLELMIQLGGFVFLLLSNIVLIAVFFSKQNSRIKFCEEKIIDCNDKIKVLFDNDRLQTDEMKTLYEIKGQLELLIKHFTLNK